MKFILIMGPQGSGKSTQAKLLAERLDMEVVMVGAIFRQHQAKQTELGTEAAEYTNKGNLVPNRITNEMLQQYCQKHPSPNGYIIDGYPRNNDQYEAFSEVFGAEPDLVLQLDLDAETIMDRIQGRKEEEDRPDETPEAIKKRLEIYHEHTQPLLDRYKKDEVPVVTIDATPSVKDIHQKIFSEVQNYVHGI